MVARSSLALVMVKAFFLNNDSMLTKLCVLSLCSGLGIVYMFVTWLQ